MLSIGYKYTYQTVDRGIIEFLGPEGLYRLAHTFVVRSNRINFSFLFHYLLVLTSGFIFIFFINYFSIEAGGLLLWVDPAVINIIAIGFLLIKDK